MFKYITISTDGEEYKITALIDKKGDYICPSLESKEKNNEGFYWDNDKFLEQTLYPTLEKMQFHQNCILFDKIPSEDCQILLELFKEAIELGIFKIEKNEE